MQTAQGDSSTPEPTQTPTDGPVDHSAWSQQKTARDVEPTDKRIERDTAGVWHVYTFEEARAVLRSGDTKQAGFGAQFFEMFTTSKNQGILYMEGQPHHEQRRKTARFFTPKAVSANYRPLMERLSDKLVAGLRRKKRADLSQISFALALQVAAQVVGLTNSRLPGMDKRLEGFFKGAGIMQPGSKPLATIRFMWRQRRVISFFFLDVKPAINARRRKPQEDVISHLISQDYTDQEILNECLTYAAAGMVTTREFISVAAWHFLEHPELCERYLAAPEEDRYEMLHETLRLEPVIGHLMRRATADVAIQSSGAPVTIPQGDFINVHIYAANAEESVVGDHPLELCPGRAINGDNIPSMLMSFGDGHHRCPGAYLAIQETDILLQRLLTIPGLRIETKPTIGLMEIGQSYELRNFILAAD
ncbi:MAG TPA: cytochrome P450 [Ktedonobacterales bacterium]|jgi:cytochrome P450